MSVTRFNSNLLSYYIGVPLYLGLVGSFCILLGCTLHCATVYRLRHPKRFVYISMDYYFTLLLL